MLKMSLDVGARTYYSYFSIGSGPTVMTRVQCTGRETNLLNCSYRTDSSSIRYCDYYDYYYYYSIFGNNAGVRCQRGTRIDSIVNYSKSICLVCPVCIPGPKAVGACGLKFTNNIMQI